MNLKDHTNGKQRRETSQRMGTVCTYPSGADRFRKYWNGLKKVY